MYIFANVDYDKMMSVNEHVKSCITLHVINRTGNGFEKSTF